MFILYIYTNYGICGFCTCVCACVDVEAWSQFGAILTRGAIYLVSFEPSFLIVLELIS